MTPKRSRSRGAQRAGRLPLVSSQQLVKALVRLGFVGDPRPSGGSHLSMYRERTAGGRRIKDVTVVVLGRKEIPRGTLRSILTLANVTEAQFIGALRKGRR